MRKKIVSLPEPQIYRRRSYTDRKLTKAEKTSKAPYLMVPRFFDINHPTTTWLVNTISSENEKELDRVLTDKGTNGLLKFELDPAAIQPQRTVMSGNRDFVITKAKYFQVLDRPEMYGNESTFAPLFHRHAVLYLTPLGLAIYLRKYKAARQLIECINRDTNKKHVLARQPQFITCLNDHYGDLMCLYDHNLAMLSETFDILNLMLVHSNWFPMEPFKLVYRKQFIETVSQFDDFLDYAFFIMLTKRSSFNVGRLAEGLLKRPTEHFQYNYMCQPSRALRITLIRDAEKVINNCKTYPRRLLRCAYYADKKLKSTVNLIRATEAFVRHGIFKLAGEPVLPFNPKEGRRKRLEALPPFKGRSRNLGTQWPMALYEFDCDCSIALLCAIMYKSYRLGKVAPFQAAMKLATKILAEGGWLDYFGRISDQEFKDYFMGLDDAEKLRFNPETFSYLRECVRITLYENRYTMLEFFSESRLRETVTDMHDVRNNDFLGGMVQCSDDVITQYVNLAKGTQLKPMGTVIGGSRVRGEGRDDPQNRYYMDRLIFPAESANTAMINTANVESCSWSTNKTDKPDKTDKTASAEVNCSNCSAPATSDSRRQSARDFPESPQLVLTCTEDCAPCDCSTGTDTFLTVGLTDCATTPRRRGRDQRRVVRRYRPAAEAVAATPATAASHRGHSTGFMPAGFLE